MKNKKLLIIMFIVVSSILILSILIYLLIKNKAQVKDEIHIPYGVNEDNLSIEIPEVKGFYSISPKISSISDDEVAIFNSHTSKIQLFRYNNGKKFKEVDYKSNGFFISGIDYNSANKNFLLLSTANINWLDIYSGSRGANERDLYKLEELDLAGNLTKVSFEDQSKFNIGAIFQENDLKFTFNNFFTTGNSIFELKDNKVLMNSETFTSFSNIQKVYAEADKVFFRNNEGKIFFTKVSDINVRTCEPLAMDDESILCYTQDTLNQNELLDENFIKKYSVYKLNYDNEYIFNYKNVIDIDFSDKYIHIIQLSDDSSEWIIRRIEK